MKGEQVMFINWLRTNSVASWILLILRLYIGYDFFISGWNKIINGFDATFFLQGAIQNASGDYATVTGWWASFLENFVLPNVGVFNFLVPWGELLVGIGLIIGTFTIFSTFMGLFLYFNFMLSGTVGLDNHIPLNLIILFIILISYKNSGLIGLDRYIKPYYLERKNT